MNTSNYKFWTFRSGVLLVEQYLGRATSQEIIDNDYRWLKEAPEGKKLMVLSDISKVEFPDIPHSDIPTLFQPAEAFSNKTRDMQVALYTGNNELADFNKASKYAQEGAVRSMTIIPFNRLESAMNWLGLTDKEKREITAELESGS